MGDAPPPAGSLLEDGRFFSDVGKLRAADQALHEALRMGEDAGTAHGLLALNAVRDSRWRDAARDLAAAEAAGFHEDWVERLRGRILFRSGDSPAARLAFLRAAEIHPGDAGALFDALCVALSQGNASRVSTLLASLEEIVGDDDRLARQARSLVALQQCDWETALTELSIFVESDNVVALNNLAVALIAQGRVGEARAAMRRALIAGERSAHWDDLQRNRRLIVGQTLRPLKDEPESDVPVFRRSGARPIVIVGVPLLIALLLRGLLDTHAWVAAMIVFWVVLSVLAVLLLRPGKYRAIPLWSGVTVHRDSTLRRWLGRHASWRR